MEKVLIIEDEAEILNLLEFELPHEGYKVDVASDGKTGLDTGADDYLTKNTGFYAHYIKLYASIDISKLKDVVNIVHPNSMLDY